MDQNLQTQLDQLPFRKRPQKKVTDKIYAHPMAEDTHQLVILEELDKRPRPSHPNRLHIGVAGLFNFEIAAKTRPDALLLLDYNQEQEKYWGIMIECFKKSDNIKDFGAALSKALQKEYDNPEGLRIIQIKDFQEYFNHSYEWLNPETFGYFKQLAEQGKIMTATIDLAGSDTSAKELGQFIKDQNFHVDTCYWSNIGQFFQPHLKGQQRGDGDVFPEGLRYPKQYYDGTKCSTGRTTWDGEETVSRPILGERKLSFKEFPAFERFLRNISAIAGEEGLHMLTSNRPDKQQTVSLQRVDGVLSLVVSSTTDADPKPMFFEGPPRRTPQAWAAREDARKAHDAAISEGRASY